MFYRVVIQGRVIGNADLEKVKRDFVRVTGLSAHVVENFFGGMPQVIKRQVERLDAERIAATLRAIGAAATVERETPGEEETAEGHRVITSPLHNGPPTIIPGSMPASGATAAPSRLARLVGSARDRWPLLVGIVALGGATIVLAPFVSDLLEVSTRPPAPVARPAPAPAPAPPAEEPAASLNAAFLQGPWRCTDQRTGVSTYWTYGDNGALVFHGDVLRDGAAPVVAGSVAPAGWQFEGQRLLHTYAGRAPDALVVSELTLTSLRYGDARGLYVECRRP